MVPSAAWNQVGRGHKQNSREVYRNNFRNFCYSYNISEKWSYEKVHRRLAFADVTLPTKRASQRVEIWRKLQRYGTVPLGNSGYLLPNNPVNEERFQWLATAIRKYKGDASIVHVQSIDNLSTPQLVARFAEARGSRISGIDSGTAGVSSLPPQKQSVGRLSRCGVVFRRLARSIFW